MHAIVRIKNVAIVRNLVITLVSVLYILPPYLASSRNPFPLFAFGYHLMILFWVHYILVLIVGTAQSQERGMQELFPDGSLCA